MKLRSIAWAVTGIVAFAGSVPLRAEDLVAGTYEVSVQSDVVYGRGKVGAMGPHPQERELRMDVHRPVSDGQPLAGRSAVVMAFGGAFHRGSKGLARFEEDGASDTPMGDYCRTFAAAGHVCFSIEYRLVPEDPALPAGLDPAVLMAKAALRDPVMTARIDVVRGRMGLPPLDDRTREQLWNTVFAAAEDMASAVGFVRENAGRWGVDPARIAVGGFSAGGLSAVNAAYGLHVPVKAVLSLSGGLGGFDLRKTVDASAPPGLFVFGQNDLEGVLVGARGALGILAAAGVATESAWMPGFGHFYPKGATSLGSDVTKLTLETRILRFLERSLGE